MASIVPAFIFPESLILAVGHILGANSLIYAWFVFWMRPAKNQGPVVPGRTSRHPSELSRQKLAGFRPIFLRPFEWVILARSSPPYSSVIYRKVIGRLQSGLAAIDR